MPECEKLKADPIVSRKAFAVWIGLCMADGKYTEEEKVYIKILQQMFVKDFDSEKLLNRSSVLLGLVSPAMMMTFIGGKMISHALQKKDNHEISSEEIISSLLSFEIVSSFVHETKEDRISIIVINFKKFFFIISTPSYVIIQYQIIKVNIILKRNHPFELKG